MDTALSLLQTRIFYIIHFVRSAGNASELYALARDHDGCLHDFCTDHESDIH